MAVNSSRSMNQDLRKGALEGKYRFLRPDTGGDEHDAALNNAEHATLHPDFGYSLPAEAPTKILPDGTKR